MRVVSSSIRSNASAIVASVVLGGALASACGSTDETGSGGQTSSTTSSTAVTSATHAATSTSATTAGSGGQGGFMEEGHLSWPAVTQAGNGVLSSMRIVTILAPSETEAATLDGFDAAVPSSNWYGLLRSAFNLGAARPSVTLAGGALNTGDMLDAAGVRAYVQAAIDASADPTVAPDGQTLYVVYLPVGVGLTNGPSSCRVYGYHNQFGTQGDGFGVIERCPSAVPTPSIETVTAVGSHEIAEAATDTGLGWRLAKPASSKPWQSSVWATWEGVNKNTGSAFLEIGDFCEGTRIVEGAYTYQRFYTDDAAAAGNDPCVPTLPVPYFNVTTGQDWYPGNAGQTVSIPVTGWSTAPTDDFWGETEIAAQSASGLGVTVQLTSPKMDTENGKSTPLFNNGLTGTLEVQIPPSAPSGSWVNVSIWTWHSDSQGHRPAGEDSSHLFAVGVYVP